MEAAEVGALLSVMLDPLVAPSPIEVPLPQAPLVRVITQLRFPEILAIEQRDFVAPFQEALRGVYPVLRQEQTQGLVFTPLGVQPAKPQIAWRFADVEEQWRVSLTPGFLSLEATKYTSRADFFERLAKIVQALDKHVEPKLIDRVGVRYIARITGSMVDDINELVIPEVRGIVGTSAASHATHAVSETIFAVDDVNVRARWGSLPPGGTIDPAAIEPASERSWVLDLDVFTAGAMPFETGAVVSRAKEFAARQYAIFRWAVTDEFLRRHGGEL